MAATNQIYPFEHCQDIYVMRLVPGAEAFPEVFTCVIPQGVYIHTDGAQKAN